MPRAKRPQRRKALLVKGLAHPDALFVREYAHDLNGTRAYLASHPNCKSMKAAATGGWISLRRTEILDAVRELLAERMKMAELSASQTLEQLRRIGYVDPRGFQTPGGKLIPLHLLSPEQAASISGFEIIVKNAEAGDGHTDVVHKYTREKKVEALKLLAMYEGLLIERVQVENIDAKLAGLDEGRRRNAEAAAADRARKAAGK